jgi:hypothetical protein
MLYPAAVKIYSGVNNDNPAVPADYKDIAPCGRKRIYRSAFPCIRNLYHATKLNTSGMLIIIPVKACAEIY